MKNVNNRNCRSIEGITNLFIHYLGPRNAIFIKNILSFMLHPRIRKERLKKLAHWNTLSVIHNKQYWYKAFRHMIMFSNDRLGFEMIDAFYNCPPIKVKDVEIRKYDMLIICVVKNDFLRMNKWLEHYRKIGGEYVKFLIIDNDSKDGTFEMLKEQPDVMLYTATETYNSRRKTAWTNYVVAQVGLERWYLVVDSDEFLAYEGMSATTLSEYVKGMWKNNQYMLKAVMLDMYPKGIIGSEEINLEQFREKYIYFDEAQSYSYDPDRNQIGGGFLERVFGEVNSIRTKVPMFYASGYRFMLGSHHIYPLYDDIKAPFELILLHYKFLPGDEQHIRDAIKTGVYANGSRLYKKYIKLFEAEEGVSVYYEKSCKWDGENSVKELKRIFKSGVGETFHEKCKK